jgi:exodeoxyribonuclease-3
MLMKIATWNVNSIKARLDHVLQWIDSRKPDILMLQELKGVDFPQEPFAARGYAVEFKGQKAYNGVAILSCLPIAQVRNALPGDEGDDHARYLETDIGGVRVINIYAPNGNPVESDKFPYKLAWLRRLCDHAKALRADSVPFLIGGDFNVIPDNRDCTNPEAWLDDALFRPETKALFRELCNLGLTDALRVFHQGPGIFTFWDYFAGSWETDKGIRIDHFLASPAIADRLLSCAPDKEPRGWEKASDHTPVVLELRAA